MLIIDEITRGLINKASVILEAEKDKKEKAGIDRNIFTLLDMEWDEVTTHSTMLFHILRPNISIIGDMLLKKFLKSISVPDTYLSEDWIVEREYATSYGRMDFFLHPRGNNTKCIILELKIKASDGDQQLYRYETYIKNKYHDYLIYYLSLDGKFPSEDSISGIDKNTLFSINFENNVLPWLSDCIKTCDDYNIDSNWILQYKLLIEKLMGEGMNNKYNTVIQTKEELEAAIALSEALSSVKGQILYNFMKSIRDNFQRNGYIPILEDIGCSKKYFEQSAIPYLVYDIATITETQNKPLHLCLEIDVESDIYACWIIYEESEKSWDYVDSNIVRKNDPDLYIKLIHILESQLGVEIKENKYLSFYWDYLRDADGKRYDIRHFTNSIQLYDQYETEAGRIVHELYVYAEKLGKYKYF